MSSYGMCAGKTELSGKNQIYSHSLHDRLQHGYSAAKCIRVINPIMAVKSFPVSGDLCRLLITFGNSLNPDQARQNVGPDLDPNCLTFGWYS